MDFQQRVSMGDAICVMMGRLRTVFAVLPAPSAFSIDDRTQIHFLAAEMGADPVRPLTQLLQITVQEKVQILLPGQPSSRDNFLGQSKYIHSNPSFLSGSSK